MNGNRVGRGCYVSSNQGLSEPSHWPACHPKTRRYHVQYCKLGPLLLPEGRCGDDIHSRLLQIDHAAAHSEGSDVG